MRIPPPPFFFPGRARHQRQSHVQRRTIGGFCFLPLGLSDALRPDARGRVVSSRSAGGRRATRRPPFQDSAARKYSAAFARAVAAALRAREAPVSSPANRRDRDRPHSSASPYSELANA